MPSTRNPYAVSLGGFKTNRTNMQLSAGWEDALNADVRRMVLRHADRRVEYLWAESRPLPPELLPAENVALYQASLEEAHNSPEPEPLEFDVDTNQRLVFARERHGILGPLTVRFSDTVDPAWWGFEGTDLTERGTLNLDYETIADALDYSAEWTGITRIRLVPYEYASPEGWRCRRYRYELVREAHNGQQHMVITPPSLVFHIDAHYETAGNPPEKKTLLTRDLVERLHLRHAVVHGVDEFRV
jgi:hypothetical protein